jgi:hypothetical protein
MKVNRSLMKEQGRVVHSVDVEDLPEKGKSYCRCWRSNAVSLFYFLFMLFRFVFSFHIVMDRITSTMNKQVIVWILMFLCMSGIFTGDNVGPIVVKGVKKQ